MKAENVMFDCQRLKKLVQLWRQPDDAASPLFLALNLMDFTERAYRADTIPDIRKEAEKLIVNGAGKLAMENISFDQLTMNLNQFMHDYEKGYLVDDMLDEITSGIVDHYFSTELVLITAERLNCVPESRKPEIESLRQSFKAAVSDNVDLADKCHLFSESEPNGSELEPWKSLLTDAPDRLSDTVHFASWLEQGEK
jgi:hypothetical protein